MKVKILTHTPDPEMTIAAAAKLCYSAVGVDEICEKMTPESCEKFINRCGRIPAPIHSLKN